MRAARHQHGKALAALAALSSITFQVRPRAGHKAA